MGRVGRERLFGVTPLTSDRAGVSLNMMIGSPALRASLPLLVRLCVVLVSILGAVAIGSAVFVAIADGLRTGYARQRANGAFGRFDIEWRQFLAAIRRFRLIEMFRRIGTGLSRWFHWKRATGMGRVDTIVVKFLALMCVAAWIGTGLLALLLRFFTG